MHVRFCCAMEGFDMMQRVRGLFPTHVAHWLSVLSCLLICPQALMQWKLTKHTVPLTRQRWQFICPVEPGDTNPDEQVHSPAAEGEPWNWAHDLNMQQREVTGVRSPGKASLGVALRCMARVRHVVTWFINAILKCLSDYRLRPFKRLSPETKRQHVQLRISLLVPQVQQ